MCKITGCDRPAVARELCARHYMRERRTGSAEQTRRAGRKPSPYLTHMRTLIGRDWSRSTLYRYTLAMSLMRDLDDETKKAAIAAAARPNGTINVSKMLELAASATLVRSVCGKKHVSTPRTEFGTKHVSRRI